MRRRSDRVSPAGLAIGLGIILVLCAVIYFPRLGDDGLVSSEGHRAIPAWGMLETGDWLVPRLFELPYLRKPPGIFWAIAASSSVFGENEFAARLPSALGATALAILMAAMVSRWLGSRWGVVAGMTMALTPWIWPSARSAEIESLLTLFVGAAGLIVVDMVVRPARGGSRPWIRVLLLAAALSAGAYLKGPAVLPALIAVVAAAAMVAPDQRRSVILAALGASALSAGAFAPWVLAALGRVNELEFAAQSPTSFVDWRVWRWLWFVPTTIVTSLPWSLWPLALLAGMSGADARTPADRQAFLAAKVCSAAWLLTIVAFMVTGNPRYALPSVVFLPPVVAWGLRGLTGAFSSRRARFVSTVSLGGGFVVHGIALVAALGYVFLVQSGAGKQIGMSFVKSRESLSGRTTGIEFSRMIRDGDVLYADNLIDARPETLYYALREAGKEGRHAKAVWSPMFDGVPDSGGERCLVIRTDQGSLELANAQAIAGFDLTSPEGEWEVYRYTFVLYRAMEDAGGP